MTCVGLEICSMILKLLYLYPLSFHASHCHCILNSFCPTKPWSSAVIPYWWQQNPYFLSHTSDMSITYQLFRYNIIKNLGLFCHLALQNLCNFFITDSNCIKLCRNFPNYWLFSPSVIWDFVFPWYYSWSSKKQFWFITVIPNCFSCVVHSWDDTRIYIYVLSFYLSQQQYNLK
jgi:hypothetical protein